MSFAKPTDANEFKAAVMGAAGKKVIMQFSADFCTVCKSIEGDLAQLATEYADKIQFIYVDVTELEDIAGMYEVADLPSFIAIDPSNPAAQLGRQDGSKMDKIKELVASVAS